MTLPFSADCLKWDRPVPLSRTRILGLALQGRLCSVHAADVFSSRAGGRIAAVTLNQRRGLSWWHYWCRTLNSAASRQFCPKWALREESGPPIICSVRRLCGPSIFIAFKNPVHGLLTSLEILMTDADAHRQSGAGLHPGGCAPRRRRLALFRSEAG